MFKLIAFLLIFSMSTICHASICGDNFLSADGPRKIFKIKPETRIKKAYNIARWYICGGIFKVTPKKK